MFRDRLWLTLLLSIPTLVWSEMVQAWFGFTAPTFPRSAYIPAIFGTAVYLHGGWVLRHRLPGMMTLIFLAISVTCVFAKRRVWCLRRFRRPSTLILTISARCARVG